jgi:hypothetical protein
VIDPSALFSMVKQPFTPFFSKNGCNESSILALLTEQPTNDNKKKDDTISME